MSDNNNNESISIIEFHEQVDDIQGACEKVLRDYECDITDLNGYTATRCLFSKRNITESTISGAVLLIEGGADLGIVEKSIIVAGVEELREVL